MDTMHPKIGQLITIRGTQCRIIKVYRAGTLDCVSLDGKHAYRVTGLGF